MINTEQAETDLTLCHWGGVRDSRISLQRVHLLTDRSHSYILAQKFEFAD